MWPLWVCVCVVGVCVYLSRRYSPHIYDAVIVHMTSVWYREVLSRCGERERVLDIGIGTGTSLCANAALIKQKALHVTGIDIHKTYVKFCRESLGRSGLGGQCEVHCVSVFADELAEAVGRDYDAVYFSGSISLMPTPHEALRIAASLLKREGGRVYVTQTFQRRSVPFLSILKPLLYYLTTIDFGRLTYEHEVDAIVKSSGLRMVEKSVIAGSVDNPFQAAFLLVLAPPA
jgi:ubiquinone/menaquinone biosynthesis C-methylase UbiE